LPSVTGIPTRITANLDRRVSVAPMMERTDRHARFFLRQISPSIMLYTEMITTGAILHGDRDRFLRFDPAEHPVALQLGGADAAELAECSEIGAEWGYDEINLNVGCPSDRVQNARFGVCLMKEPDVVAAGVRAMADNVDIPVTVKARIGVDDRDSWDDFRHFVETVAGAGCHTFIIHARKAWLQGLSPKENREIPPLHYDTVYRLKQEFPDLTIVINGGILTSEETRAHLRHVDGVMIGRAAYENPWLLAELEEDVYGGVPPATRIEALEPYIAYMDRQTLAGVPLYAMARHAIGLFQGQRGARAWRRYISENGPRKESDIEVVRLAAAQLAEVA
jgi:tRNA-dihydrouridine synthase A